MTDGVVPSLPRGVRLHFDAVREVPVLLGPERVLKLDEIGEAVLREVDGVRSIAAISEGLAAKYNAAPKEVSADVSAYLQDLRDKGLVDLRDG